MEKQLQLVTFEQAKKLKQLGFDWRSNSCYILPGEGLVEDYNSTNSEKFEVSAPTVALALKWLREEKQESISVMRDRDSEEYSFYPYGNGASALSYETYEQAESAGLDYALDYLRRLSGWTEMTDELNKGMIDKDKK